MLFHGLEGSHDSLDHMTVFKVAGRRSSRGSKLGRRRSGQPSSQSGGSQSQYSRGGGQGVQGGPLRIFLVPVTHCPKEAAVALSTTPLVPLLSVCQLARAALSNFL